MVRWVLRWLPGVPTRLRQRRDLLLEFIVLHHQLAVLQRTGTRRPCFRPSERLFWALLSHCRANWQCGLIIVQPATALRWRRRGFWAIWGSGSCGRRRGGRVRISSEVRALIVRMSQENFLWGAPRIHGELLKLGFHVSQATVFRYMPRSCESAGEQGYKERQDKVLRLRRNLVDQGASGIDPTRRSCRAWHSIGLRRRGRQGGAGDRGDYGPAAASDGRGKKRKAKAAGRIEGNITTP